MSEFYGKHKNTFIEKVTLLYTQKQLDNSEIENFYRFFFESWLYTNKYRWRNFWISKRYENQKSFCSHLEKTGKTDFKYLYFVIF